MKAVPSPAAAPRPAEAAPRLGSATGDPAPAVRAAAKRRSGMGYAVGWALGIGVGAVAAGAFVGFLVNGPPRTTLPRTIADVAPPSPAPPVTPAEITNAGPRDTAPAKADTASAAAPPARDALPPLRPPQAATPPGPPEPLTSADVRDVQSRLRALGFNPGPVDGAAGPQTTGAVKQYQQARGLEASGTLDKDLLARLRLEQPQSQAQAAPPPQRRAYNPPPPPRRQQQDPLLESIERLFRR
ncbi:peptidoglycan-binding domain-containing protein [Reyranella sp.]|uniref:peptidoglycan-binding domain-containing protein n=1 Tax=Reyranella sp. TaxID=1929291 RepID=UPI0025F502E2|nr:peptidoglycan-binding domain-containing protein [Reyranella sp.]